MSTELWALLAGVVVIGYVGWLLTAIILYYNRRKRNGKKENTITSQKYLKQ